MPDHLFISYARSDGQAFAEHLHDALEADGFTTWLDRRDIRPGDNWQMSLDRAIQECWALLFVMTPGSVASDVCHAEWSRALSYKRPVLPLMVEPVLSPMLLATRQYIDFTVDFESAIAVLRGHLLWMRSPAGELQALRYRLADLKRDLELGRSPRPVALNAEIAELEQQIGYKEQALSDSEAAHHQSTSELLQDIDVDRQRFAEARAQERAQIHRPVVGSAPQGVSTSFKDRMKEAAEITNKLLEQPSDIRAVSIYGRGGVGKTALACKVLADLEKEAGVHGLVYLSTRGGLGISFERIYLDSARMLGGEAERTLSAAWAARSDTAGRIQVLLDHYGDRRCVILLDNMEDLLDKEGAIIDPDLRQFVEFFLRQRHSTRLLITSREPLNLSNDILRFEWRFPLEEGLSTEDAAALLMELDQDGSLGLKDASPALLRLAAQRVQGFPRALEALAGLLYRDPVISLADLLENERLFVVGVIENLIREAQSRLDTDERKVMQALAVYRRPVLETAVRFLLEPFVQGLDVSAVLRRLARARYVTLKRGTGEYILHSLDQDYSYEQIPSDTGDGYHKKALEHRAAEYYVLQRLPKEQWRSMEDLAPQLAEFEHRLAAGEYDIACELLDEIDYQYLMLWGHSPRVRSMREALVGKLSRSDLQLSNYEYLGRHYHRLGRQQDAIQELERTLKLAQELGNRAKEGQCLSYLGNALRNLGHYRQAIEHYTASLTLARELHDRWLEGFALSNMGDTYHPLGRLEQAVQCSKEALEIMQEVKDLQEQGSSLGNLGRSYRSLGRLDDALEYYGKALEVSQKIGDRRRESLWLSGLGWTYRDLGNIGRAEEMYDAAFRISQEIDYWKVGGTALRGLAAIYLETGRLEEAIHIGSEAVQIAHESSDPRLICRTKLQLGWILLVCSNLQEALVAFQTACEWDVPIDAHEAFCGLGISCLRLGENNGAIAAFQQAIERASFLAIEGKGPFSSWYTLGLARTGLFLLGLETEKEGLIAYQRAIAVASYSGILSRERHKLDELERAGGQDLSAIRSILTEKK